jgi:hypothetical protein
MSTSQGWLLSLDPEELIDAGLAEGIFEFQQIEG